MEESHGPNLRPVIVVLALVGIIGALWYFTRPKGAAQEERAEPVIQQEERAGKTRCPMCGMWQYREAMKETVIGFADIHEGREDKALVCKGRDCQDKAYKRVSEERERYIKVLKLLSEQK